MSLGHYTRVDMSLPYLNGHINGQWTPVYRLVPTGRLQRLQDRMPGYPWRQRFLFFHKFEARQGQQGQQEQQGQQMQYGQQGRQGRQGRRLEEQGRVVSGCSGADCLLTGADGRSIGAANGATNAAGADGADGAAGAAGADSNLESAAERVEAALSREVLQAEGLGTSPGDMIDL
jgi:hypothetical protein